jgi:predicted transcriptional regulator
MDRGLDFQIHECLKFVGVSSPVDWDVLVFVYRHQASLANAEQIARLLGYSSTEVADALAKLESITLIRRSRASLGVRLYQFVAAESDRPAYDHFQKLIKLAGNRAGRSLLFKKLRRRPVGLSLALKKDRND